MSALKEKLVKLIRSDGPISIAQFMAMALTDPVHGYYVTRNPIGRPGDFITAPEISQMFGELIGLFLAQAWEDRGRPLHIRVVELGPGRGTLLADALRVVARARPDFVDAAHITLVDASPVLREAQARMLSAHNVEWVANIDAIPDDAPLFLVANEFFDALPVHQYVRAAGGWHERIVAAEGDELVFALAPEPAPIRRDASPGEVYELQPATTAIAAEIARCIEARNGVALIIDYAHFGGLGDTFQAVKGHVYADPLAEPGEADLTVHVDYAALADAVREAGAEARGPVPQGYFLEALGIGARAEALKRSHPEEAGDIDMAVARLTASRQMGTLFKALAICQAGSPALPGF